MNGPQGAGSHLNSFTTLSRLTSSKKKKINSAAVNQPQGKQHNILPWPIATGKQDQEEEEEEEEEERDRELCMCRMGNDRKIQERERNRKRERNRYSIRIYTAMDAAAAAGGR